jgi:putative FmdB family regulatory protein
MPLYDYACTKCGRTFEVRRGFNETHQDPCAVCGAPVRRVFNAAPVLFKGSGFYVTDSRKTAAKPEKSEKPASGEKPASEGSAPAASASAESTPAKTEPKKASEPAA